MNRKYVKFIGKFADLKTIGYKFQHMYANNYMCWTKHADPEGYGDTVWIWKKGRDVEFNDINSLTYLLIEQIKADGGQSLWIKKVGNARYAINMNTRIIEPYSYEKHAEWNQPFCCRKNGKMTFDQDKLDEFLRTWMQIRVTPDGIMLIQELLSHNMIEISEREVSV
ncbi:MAG: hypothetical protein WC375_03425 [Methanomassiliicoccales archaeon]|jgi:hypothetical protein